MRKVFLMTAAVLMIFVALTATENLRGDENLNVAETVDEPETIDEEILPTRHVNWWETNFVTATGHGVAPETDEVTRRTQALARRSALLDAYRNLAEKVAGVRVTAKKNLVKTEVDAVIKFVTVVSEDYDEFGNCTVVVQVPIFGVTNSIAEFAFPPVTQENFPPPTKNKPAAGHYTGLIIDCGDLELNPVLAPEIRNKKRTIYRYGNLEREKVLERGIVEYVAKDTGDDLILAKTSDGKKIFAQVGSGILVAQSNSRAGDNPLIVNVSELSDDNTCPVISTEDADKILSENELSHFLDEGAVVFTGNRIRGMRL